MLASSENTLVVPRAAVGRVADRDVVWVQQGERFVEQLVEVGLRSDTEVTVLSGIGVGDVIAAQSLTDTSVAVVASNL